MEKGRRSERRTPAEETKTRRRREVRRGRRLMTPMKSGGSGERGKTECEKFSLRTEG